MVQYVDMNQISQLQGTAPVDSQPKAVYIPSMHALGQDEFVSSTGCSSKTNVGMVATVGALILGGATLVACKGKGLKAFAEDIGKFFKARSVKKEAEALGCRVEIGADGKAIATLTNGRIVEIDKICERYGISTVDAKGAKIDSKALLQKVLDHEKRVAEDAETLGITIEKDSKGQLSKKTIDEYKLKREALEKRAKKLKIEVKKPDGTLKTAKEIDAEIKAKTPGHYAGSSATATAMERASLARSVHRVNQASIGTRIFEQLGALGELYKPADTKVGRWIQKYILRHNVIPKLKDVEKAIARLEKAEKAGNLSEADARRLDRLHTLRDLIAQKEAEATAFKKFMQDLRGIKDPAERTALVEEYLLKMSKEDRANLPKEIQDQLNAIHPQ